MFRPCLFRRENDYVYKKGVKNNTYYIYSIVDFNIDLLILSTMETYAANKTLVYEQSKNADILASNKYSIKLNVTADLEINVFVPAPIGVTFTIKNSSGKVVGNPMVLTNYDVLHWNIRWTWMVYIQVRR